MPNMPYSGDRPREDLSTRARIIDAAMAEFAEHGHAGATMRGIAGAADVSVGLVQHYFSTKDGLRGACDDRVLALIRIKTEALDDGRLGDPDVLAGLVAMGPAVQRYVGRALVDGSPRMAELFASVAAATETFLTDGWPERYAPGSRRTRDAAAAMTAVNSATMVLQEQVARRLDVQPFTEAALFRIGAAMLDVFETMGDFAGSPAWADVRQAVKNSPDHLRESHPDPYDDQE